jgi:threonine synthase
MLECPNCGKIESAGVVPVFCPNCRASLFAAPLSPRAGMKRAVRSKHPHPLVRYGDFLPLEGVDPSLSLGEGNTPLLELKTLERRFGVSLLFAKNEAQNPTGSFKDRGTAVAVQKARLLGFHRIGTVSTGNMAASTAAYGARGGFETYVLLKEGTPEASLRAAGIYGPTLVTVRGDYGRLFHKSLDIGKELGIYFMNSVDPFRLEGYKITGFEIFSALGDRPPGSVFVPLSSGGHLIGLMRAFEDLLGEGLIDDFPTFVGVQAAGCAPLARAFETGQNSAARWTDVRTAAHAISNPSPPAGDAVLRMIRRHRGMILSVSDEDMRRAQDLLAAEEGLFCQPESAASLAGFVKCRKLKSFRRGESAVLVLTGSGLKALQSLDSFPLDIHEFTLDGLEDGFRSLT